MDKGYDSEEIHELIRDTMHSCSLIPVRTRKRKRISGYYRKRLAQSFDFTRYHQRNKVETAFSVMKRKYGESLKVPKRNFTISKTDYYSTIDFNSFRNFVIFSFVIRSSKIIDLHIKRFCLPDEVIDIRFRGDRIHIVLLVDSFTLRGADVGSINTKNLL